MNLDRAAEPYRVPAVDEPLVHRHSCDAADEADSLRGCTAGDDQPGSRLGSSPAASNGTPRPQARRPTRELQFQPSDPQDVTTAGPPVISRRCSNLRRRDGTACAVLGHHPRIQGPAVPERRHQAADRRWKGVAAGDARASSCGRSD
jgi:hypothetical protein